MQNKKDINQRPFGHDDSKTLQRRLQKEQFHKNVLELGDDEFSNFFQKKNERIATAVYLVTDFFPENDPLRFRLRDTCVEVLHPSSLKDKRTFSKSNVFDEQRASLEELSSLWNLSYYAGYLSEMNFEILKGELLSLFWLLEARSQNVDAVELAQNFFELSTLFDNASENEQSEKPFSSSARAFRKGQDEGHLWDMDDNFFKDIRKAAKETWNGNSPRNLYRENTRQAEDVMSFMSETNTPEPAPEPASKKTPSFENTRTPRTSVKRPQKQNQNAKPKTVSNARNQSPKTAPKNTPEKVKQKSNNRRDTILEIIGKKGEVSVKDIAEIIDDVSEKTLQRELMAMVAEGVLKKEGERRWSRYSIQA